MTSVPDVSVDGPREPSASAGLWPRFGAAVYEAILLFAIGWIGSFVFVPLVGDAVHGVTRHLYQAFLLILFGSYFTYCWIRSGQTLGMKTWGLRVQRDDGARLGWRLSAARYGLAWISLLFAGAGFVWAVVDPDRKFLHDRVLGTRIVRVPI